jgi:hypothetical protein
VWHGSTYGRFSDLTNKIIEDDAEVRIVVEQHPALENPVEIEASEDEVDPIRKARCLTEPHWGLQYREGRR